MRHMLGVLVLAVLVLVPAAVRGQALAERIPADAVVYVGWTGEGDPGFAKSNLKTLLDTANVPEQLKTAIAKMVEQAATQGLAAGENAKIAQALLPALWSYPSAVYFAGLDMSEPGRPAPKLALIAQAGAEAPKLAEQIATSLAAVPDRKVPVTAKAVGNFVLITVGKPQNIEALLADPVDPKAKTMAKDAAFLTACGQVDKNPALLMYANGATLLGMMEDAVAASPNGNARNQFGQVEDVLNLGAVKEVIVSGAYDGANWRTQTFVQLDTDRSGVAALLDNKPLSDGALRMIPKTAAWAGVIRFDGNRLITDIKTNATKVDDKLGQRIEGALQAAANMLGVDLQKDLLAALSDEWVYYGTADATGNSIKGAVFINKLKNEKAAEALEALETALTGMMVRRQGAEPVAATRKAGELVVHTITLPQASLTWAVDGGCLFVAQNSQTVELAAAWMKGPAEGTAKRETILDNADFAALKAKLGVEKFSSVDFADLRKTGPEAYDRVNALLTTLANNPDAPKLALPPLAKLTPLFSPLAGFAWSDQAGFHAKGLEPFPGAELLGGDTLASLNMAQAARQARGPAAAREAPVAAQLRQIGQGFSSYARDNQGLLPPDLGTLVARKYVPARLITGQAMPVDVAKLPAEEQAAWVNKNSRFEYLLGGQKLAEVANPAQTPAAHEKLDLVKAGGPVSILYGDGRVRSLPRAEAEQALKK